MTSEKFDLLIIGGGINGVGIAADAAQRGLSVMLCERDDFAAATSSASSKLLHGGLRYLEHYEFRLVREALIERQRLLKLAPHIIKPLRFIAPYVKKMRPAWLIRLGLFIYDHLYFNNRLPHTQKVTPFTAPIDFASLNPAIKFGFSYYDCSVLDARLVILNAIVAQNNHATLLSRTQFISATRYKNDWQVLLRSAKGEERRITAKCLINAAGPWVGEILDSLHIKSAHKMSLVQGSHIIVPQLYVGNHAYILQNDDERVVFAIPYHFNTTLIGTTDVNFKGKPAQPHISEDEQHYLCKVINKYFTTKISSADILHSYCGIRPLLADDSNQPSEITRDYKLELDTHLAPILSIFEGKITTYRKLAENAVNSVKSFFPTMRSSVTATTPLPGADFPNNDFQLFQSNFLKQYPWLDKDVAQRYINSYGTLAHKFLNDCHAMADLGEYFGAGLYASEVNYLIDYEWAQNIEDIMWRRTKLGLILNFEQQAALKKYLKQNEMGKNQQNLIKKIEII